MREELFGLGDGDDDDDEDRNVGWSEERATSAPLSTPTEAIRRDVKPPRSGGGSTGVAKQYIDVNLFGVVASALFDFPYFTTAFRSKLLLEQSLSTQVEVGYCTSTNGMSLGTRPPVKMAEKAERTIYVTRIQAQKYVCFAD